MPEGWWPSGVTPRPRSCGCAGAGGPRGGGEEIPFIQGKEQQLRFAGAAVKRHPTPKVRGTEVRYCIFDSTWSAGVSPLVGIPTE